MRDRPALTSKLRGFGTTIFSEMTRLAIEHDAINLAQGFPDFDGPEYVKDAAVRAIRGDANQYARMQGAPVLTEAITADIASRHGLAYDPLTEVVVTSGATEAIHCALLALCEPGDEVVVLEPYYDSYRACCALAGASPRFVTLHAPEFRWAEGALEAAFSDRTRVVLLNTPHNPTGRVLSRAELTAIADLCKKHDAYCVTDEVYDRLVFAAETPVSRPHGAGTRAGAEPRTHDAPAHATPDRAERPADPASPPGRGDPQVPEAVHPSAARGDAIGVTNATNMASLPGMRERTLTICSTGKTFSLTGWKIGWATGPAELVRAVATVHQFVTFAVAHPFQHAMAEALRAADEHGYYATFLAEYAARRALLCEILADCGFGVTAPEGTYFVMADLRPLGWDDDVAFCRHLTEDVGVAAIPPTAFYENKDAGRFLARFAFCKATETLERAGDRLRRRLRLRGR